MLTVEQLQKIQVLMWSDHKQLWQARARGSNEYHEAPTVEQAVGLALNTQHAATQAALSWFDGTPGN